MASAATQSRTAPCMPTVVPPPEHPSPLPSARGWVAPVSSGPSQPQPWPPAHEGLGCVIMAEIVMRVRLISGERLDVAYDEPGRAADDVVEHVISVLADGDGSLRCTHGDRLIVLYGRSVATLEVAPRGAVL